MEGRIRSVLAELGRFSGIGGLYFAFDQRQMPLEGEGVCRFCSGCLRHARAGGLCQSHVNTAAVQGFAIGDAWYCRCWLGVDCFVVPVAPANEIIGAIEVGGFFSPGEGEAAQGKILSRLAGLDSGGLAEQFVSALQGMRELEFRQVRAAAGFVLDATFAKGLNPPALFAMRQKIFQQQQRLTRRLRDASGGAGDAAAPPRLFGALEALAAAPAVPGQEGPVRQAMDNFLTSLLLDAGGDLARLKAGLLLLFGLMARRQAERGGGWPVVMGRVEEKLLELETLDDPESLCFWAETLVLPEPVPAAAKPAPAKLLSDRVHAWLRQHYAGKRLLDDAAAALGASRSSLIHKLKKETGKTFGDLVVTVRLSEAKRLLAFTSLSVGEVCRRCGFRDQSYFTKVFRREINLTPREFRRLLTESQGQSPELVS